MIRTLTIVCLLFAAAAFSFPEEAHSISPNNPWRTATLSGVNYGSMTWEQQHKKSGGGNGYHRRGRRR